MGAPVGVVNKVAKAERLDHVQAQAEALLDQVCVRRHSPTQTPNAMSVTERCRALDNATGCIPASVMRILASSLRLRGALSSRCRSGAAKSVFTNVRLPRPPWPVGDVLGRGSGRQHVASSAQHGFQARLRRTDDEEVEARPLLRNLAVLLVGQIRNADRHSLCVVKRRRPARPPPRTRFSVRRSESMTRAHRKMPLVFLIVFYSAFFSSSSPSLPLSASLSVSSLSVLRPLRRAPHAMYIRVYLACRARGFRVDSSDFSAGNVVRTSVCVRVQQRCVRRAEASAFGRK